jgi:serine/threonine protein kinase
MTLLALQNGRYRVLRLLGSGAMGEVYLVEDERINRQVAIKVVRAEATAYPNSHAASEAARLFQREAMAIAQLDHPNILPLFDFGEENLDNTTFTYMVMPFCSEGSFSNWLQQHGNPASLSLNDIAQLVYQAAGALQCAHDHRIIHLDVKPSNFLIRSRPDSPNRPELLLADFGVAKLSATTSDSSQAVRGTPTYMAPEQWRGQPVPATDQYALAVMAYRLLTGRYPFEGRPEQIMYQHLNDQPQAPSTFNPRIPADLDAVILRALAKKPEDRFASISQFALAFQQAAEPNSSSTSQTTSTSDTMNNNRTKSNRPTLSRFKASALLYLIATALLGLLAGIVLNAFGKLPPYVATIAGSLGAAIAVLSGLLGTILERSFPKGIWRNANRPVATFASILTVGFLTAALAISSHATGGGLIPTPTPPPPTATGGGLIPTPTLPIPVPGRVLYESHDFRGWTGTSDWKVLSATNTLVNDATSIHSQPPYGPSIPAPYLVQGSNDYAVEARIQVTGTNALFFHPWFGITVRGKPVGASWQGYYVGVGCNSYLTSVFITDVNTIDSYLKEAQFAPGTSWHTYRVEVKANTIWFLVDGGLLLELQDNTYLTGGQVGLFCYSVQLSVSDFKVIGL